MFGSLIASATVGAGGAASIDFTSIPQTYTDLTLVISTRATDANGEIDLKINNSTSAIYTVRRLTGNGSSAGSSVSSNQTIGYSAGLGGRSDYTASTFGSTIITIPNYTGSANKTFSGEAVNENNATGAQAYLIAGL